MPVAFLLKIVKERIVMENELINIDANLVKEPRFAEFEKKWRNCKSCQLFFSKKK